MKGYIYKVTNIINNKIYIGQTIRNVDDRWKQHIKDSKQKRYKHIHFYRALNKYDIDNFTIETIDYVLYEDIKELKDKLNELEKYYILKFDSFKNGYNSSLGGEGNVGLKHSDESKEKMRKANLGRTQTDETRKKKSESNLKYFLDNPRVMTSTWIEHSSKAHKKPIIQSSLNNEFIKLWDGAVDIEKELDINHSNIQKCCVGKYKTTGGYKWVYYEDYQQQNENIG